MACISARRSVIVKQEMATIANPRQPQQMSELALKRAQEIARHVVLALGGHGLSAR